MDPLPSVHVRGEMPRLMMFHVKQFRVMEWPGLMKGSI